MYPILYHCCIISYIITYHSCIISYIYIISADSSGFLHAYILRAEHRLQASECLPRIHFEIGM